MAREIKVGVLSLQGAFIEHIKLLHKASSHEDLRDGTEWAFLEVRKPQQLLECDALIIPGGESTTVSLVAARSGLLEPLRDFVKYAVKCLCVSSCIVTNLHPRKQRKPTWGTCAGLIMLAEVANRTKKGGQELIGGLDVRVNRNHFGRQTESFEANLDLPFLLSPYNVQSGQPFPGVFIRAPVVEKLLLQSDGAQEDEGKIEDTVVAPPRDPRSNQQDFARPVKVLASLPGRSQRLKAEIASMGLSEEIGDIVAVQQANVFGTSFHPELTDDVRIHVWWLKQVKASLAK